MALGELQTDILGSLQRLGKASVRDIMKDLSTRRHVAYTTVSTVLDRLYRKGLVRRVRMLGRGGTRYVYSCSVPEEMRETLVQRTLSSLVRAFGPSIVPTIYDNLERISKKEASDLRRRVAKARR